MTKLKRPNLGQVDTCHQLPDPGDAGYRVAIRLLQFTHYYHRYNNNNINNTNKNITTVKKYIQKHEHNKVYTN